MFIKARTPYSYPSMGELDSATHTTRHNDTLSNELTRRHKQESGID